MSLQNLEGTRIAWEEIDEWAWDFSPLVVGIEPLILTFFIAPVEGLCGELVWLVLLSDHEEI